MHGMRRFSLLTAILLLVPAISSGQVAAPDWAGQAVGERDFGAPPSIAAAAADRPARTLPTAELGARDDLNALRQWNRAGNTPTRIGFTRSLPEPILLADGLTLAKGQGQMEPGVHYRATETEVLWATSIRVEGAWRLRLRLDDVNLPADVTMWVWGGEDIPIGFGTELTDPDRAIWTPSVSGNTIHFELRAPRNAGLTPTLRIDRVLEMFPPDEGEPSSPRRHSPASSSLSHQFREAISLPACTIGGASCGQTINGTLSSSDCTGDSFYFDFYAISLLANQNLTVTGSATGETVGVAILDVSGETILADNTGFGSVSVSYTPSFDRDVIVGIGFDRVSGFGPYQIVFACGGSGGDDCLADASCYDSSTLGVIESYRKAVAHLQYVDAGDAYICSGGLLNDTDASTVVPYLLTANHCFDNQAAASSLEAFWDYRSSSCNGAVPNPDTLPRSNGATLLQSSPNSDFTFVRLNSIPTGRFLLGWDSRTSSVTGGTLLHRIAHPSGLEQHYSRTIATMTSPTCDTIPRPRFIYSMLDEGTIAGGSSGAPVIIDGGYVVGQLLGTCGVNPDDICDTENLTVDGAFAETWSSVSSYLQPNTGGCTTCVPDQNTLCLLENRFKVQVRWRNQFFTPVTEGKGSGIIYGENLPEVLPPFGTISEIGFFSMFPHAPTRVELVVKLISGININDHFWVYVGGMVNNEYWITVTDTETCAVWERYNPHNTFQMITDQFAFPFP